MFKRFVLAVLIMAFGLGGALALPATTQAQEPVNLVVVAVDAAQPVLEDWIAAYQAANPPAVFQFTYEPTDDDVLAQALDADLLIYHDYEQAPPVEFECGIISRAYVLLPDLGARYLSSEACHTTTPETEALADFLDFVVSPDGQQIAIELGLLPDVVEVVDQAGETVQLAQPVRTVISAYGVSTYYVYTVGAGDRLAAASYIGVRGPAAQDAMRRVDPDFDAVFNAIPVLNQREISLEEVAELAPDVVLASARTQWVGTVEELGIPVLRFEGETPERLKEAMSLMGLALGPDALHRAEMFNNYYDVTLARIAEQVAAVETVPRVYFSGTEPLRVASGDMYQTAMIEAAGGVSVSADLTGFWNDVNLEQVALWDPDVIFVPTYGGANVEAFTESEEWSIISAVQNGHVYQLPSFISPWDTPLPDSILGIIWMAEKLHPDQIDLDCAAKVSDFYPTFYDYAISEDEVATLCN